MLGTGLTIDRGSILLSGGKIASVVEGDIPAPDGAVVIDAAGRFVTPGLIDTHSHLGVYPMPAAAAHMDGNEMVDPVTPQAQSVDAFWPQDPGIERAVAGGVTTIQVLPGSGNLIGGRAVTIKLRPGLSARQMHVPGAPDGLKMACGENPKRYYGKDKHAPMTRMGNLAAQRAAFLKARKLSSDWARWSDAESRRIVTEAKKRAVYDARREERSRKAAWCREDPDRASCAALRSSAGASPLDDGASGRLMAPYEEPEPTTPLEPPERDPGLETLAAALEGRVLLHVHCYRADDMLAMLALADEVGFRVRSFHHAIEAYKIRGQLAARGVAVSTWADWWGFKMEAYDGIPENAGLVHEAGARAIIHSDSAEGIQRLNQEAGKALASARHAGVHASDGDAIRWITANPAWALGIDHRIGTLAVGMDADVVLWSRNPLSVYAVAEKVWIDGALIYDRDQARADPPWSDFELGQDGAILARGLAPLLPAGPLSPRTAGGVQAAGHTVQLTETTPPAPQRTVTAIIGATVHTGDGRTIEDGVVVIQDGLIASVGKGVTPPAGATIIQASGAVVTPGLTDPLTSVGIVEVDLEESARDDHQGGSDRIRAGFRAAEAYNPASPVIGVTRSEGTFARRRAAWERNQSRPFSSSRLDLEALSRALGRRMPRSAWVRATARSRKGGWRTSSFGLAILSRSTQCRSTCSFAGGRCPSRTARPRCSRATAVDRNRSQRS